MTYREGKTLVIEETPPERCMRCAQWKECRQAGSHGETICVLCATPEEVRAYKTRLVAGLDSFVDRLTN